MEHHSPDRSPKAGRDGDAKVESHHVLPVLQVLDRKTLVQVASEKHRESVDGLWPKVGVLSFQGLHRVARHQARDKEIETDGCPQREQEKTEPPYYEPHSAPAK